MNILFGVEVVDVKASGVGAPDDVGVFMPSGRIDALSVEGYT